MPASQSRKSPKTAPRLQMLPIAKLLPTSDNRRRPISKASVESLARSMKKDGVLQPIVVRPHPTKRGRWEIRAGERRWHAARLAGFTEIPAIVRALDDQSALSVTIAENLQRENLHPLEEAATIQLAFDRGYDIKSVAASLGKSEQYVAKRASLSRLSKSWKTEILRPDSQAGRLTVPHLELIARLPAETQDHLAENDFQSVLGRGFPTVAELRRLIDGGLQSLRAMPWPLDDDTLDPKAGSCLNCPKRSCRQPLLFDGEEAEDDGKPSKTDRCLDPACFARKQTAWVLRCETTLRQQHPDLRLIQVSYGRLTETAEKAFGDRLTHVYQPRIVKPTDKGATPVMQVDGPKAGALVHVDLGDKPGDRNGKAQRPKNADGTPKPLTLAERQARLQKRRDAVLVNKVEEMLRAMKPADVVTLIANFAKRTDAAAKRFDPLALVLAFGTSQRHDRDHDDGPWKRYEELLARKKDLPTAVALQEVAQIWTRRLGGCDSHSVIEQAADAKRIGALLGIDTAAIEAEAITSLPEPASWSNMRDAVAPTTPLAATKQKGGRAKARR